MRIGIFHLFVVGLLTASLISCKDDMPEEANLDVPQTYAFEREGITSVRFSGQVLRQAMLDELLTYMKKPGNGEEITEIKLHNMYDNENNPFESAELNESSKSLSSTTSASPVHGLDQSATILYFKKLMTENAEKSVTNKGEAKKGVAGVIGGYYVNSLGLEYRQIVAKGLMGAILMDQAVNKYLSDERMVAANNEAVEEGENFTKMEHYFDEAYGYWSTAADFNVNNEEQEKGFWGKYFAGLEENFAIASETYNAYRTGRAAVVAKDYDILKDQIAIIRKNFERACAYKAIGYLNKAITDFQGGQTDKAFHHLSESIGFTYSLRYAHNAKVNTALSDEVIQSLLTGDGFWSADIIDRINKATSKIGTAMGFDAATIAGSW